MNRSQIKIVNSSLTPPYLKAVLSFSMQVSEILGRYHYGADRPGKKDAS
jgi:hypothetical protein